MPDIVRDRVRDHWNRERMTLVVMGLVCFYITYVSYRNLKSFLPFIMGDDKYDRELHLMDRALFFGHEPATILHAIFGTGSTAHVLSSIYLWFLPLVPAGAGRLAGVVAQHHLRLLVRHLPVPGLGARHRVLLRAPDARPRLPVLLPLQRPARHRVRAR